MSDEGFPPFSDEEPDQGPSGRQDLEAEPSAETEKTMGQAGSAEGGAADERPWEATTGIAETEQPVPTPQLEEKPVAPSRLSRLLRSALRWVTGVVVVFALGILVAWASRIQPQSREIGYLRSEKATMQATMAALEDDQASVMAENHRLQTLSEELQTQAEGLQTAFDESQIHLKLLKVLVDVSAAQLAMSQEDPLGAKAALASTDDLLAQLEADFSRESGVDIRALRDRLSLASEAIGNDAFSAQRDLEILVNKLLSIERLYFGE